MNRKIIRVSIILNGRQESFTADGFNKLTSTGFAVSCTLNYGNGAITPTASITIYGLPFEKMLKLMRVQWNTMDSLLNIVQIEVGDSLNNMAIVYRGNITQATIDANNAPDIPLIITSQMAMLEKAKVTEPYTSPKGQSMVIADIVRERAELIGYTFENNAVDIVGTDITLEGSELEKIQKLAHSFDFDLYVDDKLICICAKGVARTVKIPLITPRTGLIGYPVPDIKGVSFSCLYDPLVKFGGVVHIDQSVITVANGYWRLYGYSAQLESNIPNGKWQIDALATWRDSKDLAIAR